MATGLSFLTALVRNSTQQHFADKKPQRKPPEGPGVHDLLGERMVSEIGVAEPGLIQIVPYGTCEPGTTFLMRLWSWSRVEDRDVWDAVLLVEFKARLGDIDAGAIDRKAFKADSITLRDGITDPEFVAVCSPGEGVQAHLNLYVQSGRYLEFDCARNGSPAAVSANALWKPLQ